MTVSHPAKFSSSIITVLGNVLEKEYAFQNHTLLVLDPMAGVGGIHALANEHIETWGVELEPEWAAQHERTFQGDAIRIQFMNEKFDAVMTSPAYGNRMADHHNAKDSSKRMTYKHQLGRDLSENSGACLQWGKAYKDLHIKILAEMVRVTKSGGLLVVNIKNHFRREIEQLVSEWWLAQMLRAGLNFGVAIPVETPSMGFGANRGVRAENEWVLVARKR